MKKVILACSFLLSFCALSAEYRLRSNAVRWQAAESYEENVLPPENSDIIIPSGLEISVSSDGDFAFLNTMNSVKPQKNSFLVVHVQENMTNELSCAIYATADKHNTEVGTLVKEGKGVLNLVSPGRILGNYNELADCNVHVQVRAGRLFPFKGISRHSNFRFFKRVFVAQDAVLELPPRGTCEMWALEGHGMVTNSNTDNVQISLTSLYSERSVFYGSIGGKLSMNVSGGMYLYGTESSFNANALVSGFVGVMSFGAANEPGSYGATDWYRIDPGSAYVEYLGNGETVGKKFGLYSMTKGPFTMDAGANGGLDFANSWLNYAKKNNVVEDVAIVFCGSNKVNASSIGSGRFTVTAGTSDNVLKSGSGKWKFYETGSASNLGSIGVEDGTLLFDTINNRYLHSALGSSATLHGASYFGDGAQAQNLPYAFELGGAEGEPVFEYVGTAAGYAYDRPIALRGGVAHLRSSGSGPVKMRGAWMPAAGSATFVLDGSNEGDNVFSSISNGMGTVSVVKDGTGTWTLSGAQDFSGTLEVKQGTLKLSNKSVYEWYRILFKETYASAFGVNNKDSIQCKGFALYDAHGNRVGTNLRHVDDYRQIQPGESAYGTTLPIAQSSDMPWRTQTTWLSSAAESVAYQSGGETKEDYNGWSVRNFKNFNKDDPTSWLPVVMRLTNNTPEVVGCDIAHKYFPLYSGEWARNPVIRSFELQGSSDGLDWRTLIDVEDCSNVTAVDRWAKTDTPTWQTQKRKLSDVTAETFYFGSAKSHTYSTFLSRISELKVARGAAIEVSEGSVALPQGVVLTVDCAGNGVASIFALDFPQSGTLNVIGTIDETLELPLSFGLSDSYTNLSGWNVILNGKPFRGDVICRDGKVMLRRNGMLIILK